MKLSFVILAAALVQLATAQTVTNGNFGAARTQSQPSSKNASATQRLTSKPTEKLKAYPFHGELDSVDSAGQWLKLRGRTKPREIAVTKETRILSEDGRTKLAEARPGERLTGAVIRNSDGKEEARTVRLGAKPAKAKSPE